MPVTGLHHVAIRVGSLPTAVENLSLLGLPLVARTTHPVNGAATAVFGVGRHRLVVLEGSNGTAAPFGSRPVAYVSLRHQGDAPKTATAGTGLFGPDHWLDLPIMATNVELIDDGAVAEEDARGDAGLVRIESIPWSTRHRADAVDEVGRLLGLTRDDSHSDLQFPDLHTTNSMVMLGTESYLDFSEPTDPSSAVARLLAKAGNGAFALVLEPLDLDSVVALLRERAVPTVTPGPVELRVVWHDGTTGSAARILSIDRRFTMGVQLFLSAPTFPW